MASPRCRWTCGWVDGQGRVVTTTTTQTVAVQQITSTNHVTGFNEPVTIALPDPADVATV